MTYIDLGKYTFTTAADYTGFNPGNLTSVLDPSAIRVANYELYRLLINTSGVPGPAQLPSIVQAAAPVIGTSATALNISFGKNTTAGNLIVAAVGSLSDTGEDPAVTGVKLGGSADNWGVVVTAASPIGPIATLWADPSTAESSEAIAVTLAGGTGATFQTVGMAWEIAGALDTTTAADACDTFAFEYNTTLASTLQTPNILTSADNDMLIGFASAYDNRAFSLKAQPQGWTSKLTPGTLISAGNYGAAIGSYTPAGPAGSSTIYQAAASDTLAWAMLSASFFPSATIPAPAPIPFTVAVDGVTWDSEQTVAGVGYTYAIGQSPLYLKTGQTLQIFWQLPAAAYLSYIPNFNITGWFRYDPSVQP